MCEIERWGGGVCVCVREGESRCVCEGGRERGECACVHEKGGCVAGERWGVGVQSVCVIVGE